MSRLSGNGPDAIAQLMACVPEMSLEELKASSNMKNYCQLLVVRDEILRQHQLGRETPAEGNRWLRGLH
jgi:hypothetical protein